MLNEMNGAGILRLVGVMAVAVALVWALQIVAFGTTGAVVGRLTWVLGAAAIAGAGVGLIFSSNLLMSQGRA